jgi:hypothetical protein
MRTTKTHWLACTVLVGLIPIFSRLFIWLATKDGTVEPFAPQDLIAFGLVLHISNINEMKHLVTADRSWKIAHNGASLCFIAIYGAFFCLTLIGDDIVDQHAMITCVGIIALASLFISYCLLNRISKFHSHDPKHHP